jgi:hypothetical protein
MLLLNIRSILAGCKANNYSIDSIFETVRKNMDGLVGLI